MDTALEVVRIILEYFGWDGNEIEVSLCDDSIVHVTSLSKILIFPVTIFMFYFRSCFIIEAGGLGATEEASFVESAESCHAIRSNCLPNAV